jgi:D-sedoheptulose 7-phosphate isomerase
MKASINSLNNLLADRVWAAAFAEHQTVCRNTALACADAFKRLTAVCASALANGNKIMFFGNGGSAADAQHLATELTIRYSVDRPALAAIALTVDTSTLTAAANDFGFEAVFARQIEALARPGDVALGISTSGNSENIIRALVKARAQGVHAVGFAGRDGGRMRECADPLVIVPSATTARIQEMHILLGHQLCEILETPFLPAQPHG